MRWRTQVFVMGVAASAVAAGMLLYQRAPSVPSSVWLDAALLCSLALAAEALSFLLPRSAVGSMAFIPYFALAVVAPSWASVMAVALVKVVVEACTRRHPVKA